MTFFREKFLQLEYPRQNPGKDTLMRLKLFELRLDII